MAIPVISVPNGIAVSQAAAPFGYPVTVSSNGFGLGVTPVASGGRPVFDTSGTLFGPPVIPANITLPVIFGTPLVGLNLVSSSGTWSGTAATYTYQWKRGGVNIAGATSNPYLLVTADLGAMITVTVTATNGAGSASATSAAVGPVLTGVPANTVLPVISGTATVGNTLTTTNGTWTGTPTLVYTYQWWDGPVSISGANSSSYIITPLDVGEMITVTVIATNAFGATNANAAPVGPVAALGTGPTPPVLAMDAGWTSADTTPDFVITVDNTVAAGDSLRLQIQLSTSAEVLQFLTRTSGLDATHTNAYTALIDGLVADGIWSKLDLLHVYATQDSTTALLNLVSTNYNGTAVGSPTFTADRGFTGAGGSAKYINTGYNPVTATSPYYALNSAHISIWNLTEATLSTNGCFGASFISYCYLIPRYNDGNNYTRINVTSPVADNLTNPTAVGHYIGNRSASSAVQVYKNGSSLGSTTNGSTSVPNIVFYSLANNANGTAQGAALQLASVSAGGSLTATDATNFYNRLRTYMTAIGVP